jgi:transketolase
MRHDPGNPLEESRDRFIMSKGHGFLSLLATLHHHGYFPPEDLGTFQVDGGAFIAHPVRDLARGIESSNGSLGQGLSFGLGLALGLTRRNVQSRVFVLMGDSECSEGSVWEAAMLAGKLSTSNLVAIVDSNRLGNDGYGPVLDENQFAALFEALGWRVSKVDGHDHEQLASHLSSAGSEGEGPTALVCRTTKGKGVSFMENNNDWHHGRLSPKLLTQALAELGAA